MDIKSLQPIGTGLFEMMIGKRWTYWPNILAMTIDDSGKNVIVFWSGYSKQEGRTIMEAISRWNVETAKPGPETILAMQPDRPIVRIYSDIKISDKIGDVTFKTTFYAKDPNITLPPSYISKWNMLSGELVSEK